MDIIYCNIDSNWPVIFAILMPNFMSDASDRSEVISIRASHDSTFLNKRPIEDIIYTDTLI